jgi:cell division protein FtsZ
LINLDFADVRTIMSEGGAALMSVGRATGEDRARKAAEMAIASELLDITIDGARGILFNVTGGSDLRLFEVNDAAAIIKETAHPDVNLIFGAVIDPSMGDEIRITVIATGFDSSSAHARPQQSRFAKAINPGTPSKMDDKENVPTRNLAEFGSQIYNSDEIEVPAFLRNRTQS